MTLGGGQRMTFGEAISELCLGRAVRRQGWDKHQFVYMQEASIIKAEDCRNSILRQVTEGKGGEIRIGSHLDMFTEQQDIQIGWCASASDVLATDWEIVEVFVVERKE